MGTKTACNILVALLALLGIGAVFGGGALVISPSGSLLGIPLSVLARSPFRDFLIPGIILFSVLGLLPVGVAVALVKRPQYRVAEALNVYKDMHWAWTYSIYTAFALIIWIQAEMAFLQSVHWSHTLYMFLAIAILFVALLPQVRGQFKK